MKSHKLNIYLLGMSVSLLLSIGTVYADMIARCTHNGENREEKRKGKTTQPSFITMPYTINVRVNGRTINTQTLSTTFSGGVSKVEVNDFNIIEISGNNNGGSLWEIKKIRDQDVWDITGFLGELSYPPNAPYIDINGVMRRSGDDLGAFNVSGRYTCTKLEQCEGNTCAVS
jgi:hypothetical protein